MWAYSCITDMDRWYCLSSLGFWVIMNFLIFQKKVGPTERLNCWHGITLIVAMVICHPAYAKHAWVPINGGNWTVGHCYVSAVMQMFVWTSATRLKQVCSERQMLSFIWKWTLIYSMKKNKQTNKTKTPETHGLMRKTICIILQRLSKSRLWFPRWVICPLKRALGYCFHVIYRQYIRNRVRWQQPGGFNVETFWFTAPLSLDFTAVP